MYTSCFNSSSDNIITLDVCISFHNVNLQNNASNFMHSSSLHSSSSSVFLLSECIGEGKDNLVGKEGKEGKEEKEGKELKEGKEGKDNLVGKEEKEGKELKEGKEGKDNLVGKEGKDNLVGKEGKDNLVGKEGKDNLVEKEGLCNAIAKNRKQSKKSKLIVDRNKVCSICMSNEKETIWKTSCKRLSQINENKKNNSKSVLLNTTKNYTKKNYKFDEEENNTQENNITASSFSFLSVFSQLNLQKVMGVLLISFGSLNIVVGKIRSKSLGRFDYFVSLFNAIFYLLVYNIFLLIEVWLERIPRTSFVFVYPSFFASSLSEYSIPFLDSSSSEISFFKKNDLENLEVCRDNKVGLKKIRFYARLSVFPYSVSTSNFHFIAKQNLHSCYSFLRFLFTNGAWRFFAVAGFLDSIGNVLGFISQPYISGSTFSLMSQAIVPFTALISICFLKETYTCRQVCAIMCVVAGFLVAWYSECTNSAGERSLGLQSKWFFLAICGLSTLPTAMSFVIKERVLKTFSSRFQDEKLNISLMSSSVSFFQLFSTFLWLPVAQLLGQTNNKSLVEYVKEGFECFRGNNPEGSLYCQFSLSSYSLYVVINICFNILLIMFLRDNSSLFTFICLKAVLPVSILLFYIIPIPFLDENDINFSAWILLSLVFIMFGIRWYNVESERKVRMFGNPKAPCCYPLNSIRNLSENDEDQLFSLQD